MNIGLVLSSPPGYSETFFRNKIKFLNEEGIKIIIFADRAGDLKVDYRLEAGFSWNGSWAAKIRNFLSAFFRLSCAPSRSLKFYRLNKQSGYQTRKNLLSLLSAAHIINFQLDWLHFGFATTARERENLAQVLGARMAVSIRGYDMAIYPLKNPGCYELLWKNLDKLHYISDALFSLALKHGFNGEMPHRKITPAIDTKLFQDKKNNKFGDPLKILTVARLSWKKGLEYTLEALSLLHQKGIDFEYTIIGEGDDYERLMFAGFQLGIKNKVRFAGKKSPEEVTNAYQESDIYLQYSVQEGFCNAVLEAQAVGLLSIVSDAEGLPENILNGITGWVVPKRNPRALAAQIIEVLNLPEAAREKISQAAVQRVVSKFNLPKQKAEFLEFYQ